MHMNYHICIELYEIIYRVTSIFAPPPPRGAQKVHNLRYLFKCFSCVLEKFLFGLWVIATIGLYGHLIGWYRIVAGSLRAHGSYGMTRYTCSYKENPYIYSHHIIIIIINSYHIKYYEKGETSYAIHLDSSIVNDWVKESIGLRRVGFWGNLLAANVRVSHMVLYKGTS